MAVPDCAIPRRRWWAKGVRKRSAAAGAWHPDGGVHGVFLERRRIGGDRVAVCHSNDRRRDDPRTHRAGVARPGAGDDGASASASNARTGTDPCEASQRRYRASRPSRAKPSLGGRRRRPRSMDSRRSRRASNSLADDLAGDGARSAPIGAISFDSYHSNRPTAVLRRILAAPRISFKTISRVCARDGR